MSAHNRRVVTCHLGCGRVIRWCTRTELRTRLTLHLTGDHGYDGSDASDDALILVPVGDRLDPDPIDARLDVRPDPNPRPCLAAPGTVLIVHEERLADAYPRPADWPVAQW